MKGCIRRNWSMAQECRRCNWSTTFGWLNSKKSRWMHRQCTLAGFTTATMTTCKPFSTLPAGEKFGLALCRPIFAALRCVCNQGIDVEELARQMALNGNARKKDNAQPMRLCYQGLECMYLKLMVAGDIRTDIMSFSDLVDRSSTTRHHRILNAIHHVGPRC